MNKDRKREFEILWYDKMGMCGCGNPDELADFICELMDIQQRGKDKKITYEQREQERIALLKNTDYDIIVDFVFHILDHNGLMEHGGYVGNGWLTDEGRELLSMLRYNKDNNHELTN